MWAYDHVFYQIYPIGFCGAPLENDGVQVNRIRKVIDWIPHLKKLNVNAVYFGPVFESDSHGYNTRDYNRIDCRLGSDEDFAAVCSTLHKNGIRIILDGVFNHVGRGFWAFQDVLKNRENSRYKDWFSINFQGNNGYNDGLWYEGWEGHFDLVKLNLWNEEVVQHIFDAIRNWVSRFDIDGLRLDVAYCLDKNFLSRLRGHCQSLKPDFFLLGELLHGDYNQWVNDGMLHSATNYECYKGLFSSFNSMNLFEICHSLMRQFGPEYWTLYKGKHLFTFVDNHDVSRIATQLQNKAHIPLIYALAFGMPGIPCIYYGSEWGAEGNKSDGDPALRPCFDKPIMNDLSKWIAKLAKIHRNSPALINGDLSVPHLTNQQCVIQRCCSDERVLVAINASDHDYRAPINENCTAKDLATGRKAAVDGGIDMKPYSARFLRMP